MDGIDQSQCPVAESLLHVGDVVVRREGTARTRVQVVKPLVGEMRVTQILNPCHLLPRSFGVQSVSQSSQSGSVRQQAELRLELWCAETGFMGWGRQMWVQSRRHRAGK